MALQADTTCWMLVREAAQARPGAREAFLHRYGSPIRRFLSDRWRGSAFRQDVEDAAQEVVLDCMRPGGALGRATPSEGRRFRPFLQGVAQNVARRFERDRYRGHDLTVSPEVCDAREGESTEPETILDRRSARAIVIEAGRVMRAACSEGSAEEARVALLEMRFSEGLPVRAIARRWGVPAAHLHHELARAKAEFKEALRKVWRRQLGGASPSDERLRVLVYQFLE